MLAAFCSWKGQERSLVSLANGWEHLTGPTPLPASAIQGFAEGRAQALVALARALDSEDDPAKVHTLGRAWALLDLSERVGDAREREVAQALADAEPVRGVRLSRPMRPLAVLHGLARRRGENGAVALLATLRLGLFGR